MVGRVVDEAVIREDDSLGTSAVGPQGVDVALGVVPVLREQKN